MDVREQIAQMIMGKYFDHYDDELREQCRELADDILAIPAIAEGLEILRKVKSTQELLAKASEYEAELEELEQ